MPEVEPEGGASGGAVDDAKKPAWDTVVVRLSGEIGVKSRPVRSRLERAVTTHISRALKRRGIPINAITRSPGRAYISIWYSSTVRDALARVFGISSFSPALATSSKIEEITLKALQVAGNALKAGSTFAVSCRRTGRQNYSSYDVNAKVGEAVLKEFSERSVRVNLSKPDVRIGVEVANESAYVFTETFAGAGGMPYGSQGKMVALIDGSTRSTVAAWLMMRRGSPILPLLVSPALNQPSKDVLRQMKALMDWSPSRSAAYYAPSWEDDLTALSKRGLADRQVPSWPFIYADALACFMNAEGIVADDRLALGPRSSDGKSEPLKLYHPLRPVYMPLLGFEESEVQRLAERGLLSSYLEASTDDIEET
ncbi:MAG: THUMP domain-containing protein [Candidatus Bathyarchaeia archaeon]